MFLLAVCTALPYFAASLQPAASGAEPELPSYATAKTLWPNHKKIKGLQTEKNIFVLKKKQISIQLVFDSEETLIATYLVV